MLILLDEQIDVRMKQALSDFSVFTVQDMGWLGMKNGLLREQLNQKGFHFFITADKNLPFQQNLSSITFGIILINTPTLLWAHQQQFVPALINLLSQPIEVFPKVTHISVEGLSKGKKVTALTTLLPEEELVSINFRST